MSYRFRYIEEKRRALHQLVDDFIDSLNETSFDEAKKHLLTIKKLIEKLNQDIKEDEY